jgi:hypothetical protein
MDRITYAASSLIIFLTESEKSTRHIDTNLMQEANHEPHIK